VDIARYFMEFCMDESCGKCIPCRAGTVQMHRLLERILDGSAGPAELDRLEKLCDMVRNTSLCGLGQTAPNPTLSTLRYFRQEYESRIRRPPNETRTATPQANRQANSGGPGRLTGGGHVE
jgi:bidirectional [NiFe] hydrogenase diaphorase subunit